MDANYVKLAKIVQLMKNKSDCVSEIESILNSGYEINYAVPIDGPHQDWSGYTLLHFTVETITGTKCEPVLNLLLRRNADFTLKDSRGFTALHAAFMTFVKNKQSYSDSRTSVNRLLFAHFEFNNETNLRSKDGISHFHIACIYQNLAIAKFFLRAGVPVDEAIDDDSNLFPGYKPMHIGMRNRDKDLAQLLLEHGADYDCLTAKKMTPLQLLNDKNLDEDLFTKISSQSNQTEFLQNERKLRFLSQLSTDNINILDNIGLTQLHSFCMTNHTTAELDDLEKVLKDNENINAAIKFDSPIWPGQTPLHLAMYGDTLLILMLLRNGANLMAKDATDITPFDLCLKRYTPFIISSILKTQTSLKSIEFGNGLILAEIVSAFEKPNKLSSHLKMINVNRPLPMDSPLWPGFTLLHLAVFLSQAADKGNVKVCLKHGADVTIQDASNMTPLHLAFRNEKWSCINDMLNSHADVSVNPVDRNNLSHFHLACLAGNFKLVKKFLNSGCDPNVPVLESLRYYENYPHYNRRIVTVPAGSTPLHIAVAIKSKSLAKLLLDFKADPSILDADNCTWIHRAFLNDSCSSVFNNLLWHHTEALKSNPTAAGGLSHFHVACYSGSLNAAKALLPMANINDPINDGLTKHVKGLPFKLNGQTPLHLAVKRSSLKTIEFLLKNGADMEAKNVQGLNSLHVALLEEKPSIIEFLSTEFDEKKKWNYQKGMTLLHVACSLGCESLIKKCLDRGFDVNQRIDSDCPVWPGNTPMNIVLKPYHWRNSIIKMLLNHFIQSIENLSANEELHEMAKRRRIVKSVPRERIVINSEGLTALHISCKYDEPDAVEKLIHLGVDINAPTDHFAASDGGYTPLHVAVEYGSERVVRMLLNHGACVRMEDSNGCTPVQLAAKKSSGKLKIFLSLCDVNIETKDMAGKTLLDLLVENSTNSSAFLELLKCGAAKNINLSTKINLVKKLAKTFSGDSFLSLLEHIPNLTDVDEEGRNMIHHLQADSSRSHPSMGKIEFAGNIEALVQQGCDLDQQDKQGKTALYHSAQCETYKFEALLLAGADVNIADFNGKTPYEPIFQRRIESYTHIGSRLTTFLNHCHKILAAGLILHPTIKHFIVYYYHHGIITRNITDSQEESLALSSMEQIHVTDSYTLRDIFTEKMVMTFPVMPAQQRTAILQHLRLSDDMRRNFSDWLPLYKMQIRKAKKREASFNSAVNALRDLLGPRLPEHVLESIVVRLSNKDWNNVSCAVNNA